MSHKTNTSDFLASSVFVGLVKTGFGHVVNDDTHNDDANELQISSLAHKSLK